MARTRSSNLSATRLWRRAWTWSFRNIVSPFIPLVAKMFGANVITVPAKNHGHDLPAMLAAITPQTRVIFVANPNNPTGTLALARGSHRVRQRSAGARAAGDGRGLHRISGRPGGFASADPPRQEAESVLMRTFSKIFGLAGLRLGYGIGASGIDRRARKNPAAVQHQFHRAGRRAGGAGRRGARAQNAARTMRAG